MSKIEYGDLMRAAADLARDGGLDAVTMTSAASSLGVRPPSLYGHFRDRTELLDRLALHSLTLLTDEVADAIAGLAGRDAVAALANAHRRFASSEPGLWSALQRPLTGDVAAASDGSRLVALMRSALAGYRLPEEEVVHAIRFLGSIVNGFLALEQAGGFAHSLPESEVSWDRALDALDALFLSWPTGRGDRSNGDLSSTTS